KAKEARVPFLSDVAGDVLGGAQRLFNVAQGALFNSIHVTGTIAAPQIEDEPVPVLSDSFKLLFGRMLQPNQQPGNLIEAVREAERGVSRPSSRPAGGR